MVRIEAENIQVFDAEPGTRLVLALEDAGIDILHRCGGHARCTTCRVDILDGDAGPMTEREARRLSLVEEATDTMRLSCQILLENDLKIKVINRLSETDLSDAGSRPDDTIPTE
jgi:ferredoxin